MEYKVETSLYDFPAWQGGRDTLDTNIEKGDCDEVEDLIETVFFDQEQLPNTWVIPIGMRMKPGSRRKMRTPTRI